VTNYCGITPQYVEFISDTTPIKQVTRCAYSRKTIFRIQARLSWLCAAVRLEPCRRDLPGV